MKNSYMSVYTLPMKEVVASLLGLSSDIILLLEHTHKCKKPHRAVSKPVLTATVDQTVGRMLELPQSRACYRMSLVVNVAAEFSHEMECSFCDEILHCFTIKRNVSRVPAG